MAQMTETADRILTTADGTPLKQALARATRRNKIRAFILVAPLLAFVLVSFIIPSSLLFKSPPLFLRRCHLFV